MGNQIVVAKPVASFDIYTSYNVYQIVISNKSQTCIQVSTTVGCQNVDNILTCFGTSHFISQESEKKKETKEKECRPYVCVKNGNFADPCHCRRYITCTNGAATTRVCPSGLYWDDERLFCTYKAEAKCGPIKRKKKKEKADLPQCDKEKCELPFCFCSRNGMEGPIPAKSTGPKPQVIVMTFDGAINLNNFKEYEQILKITKGNKTDECPIRGTFFITHNYNDYRYTEYFYSKGHEIAVSSVTGKTLQFANETVWRDELRNAKDFLEKYANIPKEDI